MAQHSQIQIACHLGGLSATSVEEAIGTAARLGFRAVDLPFSLLNVRRVIANPSQEAAAIRALLTEFNLALTDFDLPLMEYNAPDPTVREAALAQFEALIPFMQAIRTPGVTLSPGGLQVDGAQHSMARSAAGLVQLTHNAQALLNAGIRITICPAVDTAAGSIADVLKLLDCAPDLRLTLDIGYAVYLGLSRTEIAGLFNRVDYIRIHQATKNRLQTGANNGAIDLSDLWQDLTEANYTNAISVAYLVPPGEHGVTRLDPIAETVATRDGLRNARASFVRN